MWLNESKNNAIRLFMNLSLVKNFLKNALSTLILSVILFFLRPHAAFSQTVYDNYANNETSIDWMQLNTEHFQLVIPSSKRAAIDSISCMAENIYREYSARMGITPGRITLYYKNKSAITGGIKARKTDEEFSIWDEQAPSGIRFIPARSSAEIRLRREIAYAFQQHNQYFPIDYYYYLFARPEKSPWSDAFTYFMAVPFPLVKAKKRKTRQKQTDNGGNGFVMPGTEDSLQVMRGRSQIRFFLNQYGPEAFRTLYSSRNSLLGLISYFDFNSAFERATGISYEMFSQLWRSHSNRQAVSTDQTLHKAVITSDLCRQFSPASSPVTEYNAFANIRWEPPFVLPYYITPDDFGLAAYVSMEEPMRTHEFRYYGTLSLADPIGKSFFYSQYTNNMFHPHIELALNRFPSASGFFGNSRKVKTATVLALESLWKITSWSRSGNEWYGGLTFRYMAFDYFPASTFRYHHPDLFLTNTDTRQADIKASLVWRDYTASRHTLIHPLQGEGVRLQVTAADEILGSQTRFIRLNLDSYAILPGIGKHRFYLYGNGVMDIGEPAGRDFISFSDNGNFQIPGPDFTGSINPGYDRFVRGYTSNLAGSRFVFGTIEYRIPLFFDTDKKLLGLIPPARTSFTLFSDAGIMGAARVGYNKTSTKYRYSMGAEIKRVFAAGGSPKITYEVGVAQPLTQSFGPVFYFNIKSALPF